MSLEASGASSMPRARPPAKWRASGKGQTLKVVLAQTILVALATAVLFFLRPAHDSALRGPIGLILAVFVISYPLRVFPAVLQGLQQFKFLGQLRLALWGISTVVVVVMLMLGARFYALACGWCLQQMAHDLVAFVHLRRTRPDLVSADVWRRAGPIRWRWFARGFWVNVNQIATQLSAGTDLLIVGRSINATTVVVYSSTNKLIGVLQNQPQLLAGVAIPGLSHMKTSEPRERILQATTSLTQAMLLLAGAITCVLLAVNQPFVTWWLGAHFFGGMQLTGILLLTFLLRQADYTLAVTLFAFGRCEKLSLHTGFSGWSGKRCDRDASRPALGHAGCSLWVLLRGGIRLASRGFLHARPNTPSIGRGAYPPLRALPLALCRHRMRGPRRSQLVRCARSGAPGDFDMHRWPGLSGAGASVRVDYAAARLYPGCHRHAHIAHANARPGLVGQSLITETPPSDPSQTNR